MPRENVAQDNNEIEAISNNDLSQELPNNSKYLLNTFMPSENLQQQIEDIIQALSQEERMKFLTWPRELQNLPADLQQQAEERLRRDIAQEALDGPQASGLKQLKAEVVQLASDKNWPSIPKDVLKDKILGKTDKVALEIDPLKEADLKVEFFIAYRQPPKSKFGLSCFFCCKAKEYDHITKDWSLKDIIESAQRENGPARRACASLKWMSNEGKIYAEAPPTVLVAFFQVKAAQQVESAEVVKDDDTHSSSLPTMECL